MKHLVVKYLKIIKTVAIFSIIKDLQFRINFFFGILVTLVWQFYTLIIAYALINKFKVIGNWDRDDLLILIFTWRMINGFVHFFFYFPLNSLPLRIKSGSFDFVLCKPVNSLFLASIQYFGLNNLIDGLINFTIIIFLIQSVSLLNFGTFLIFSFLGIFLQFFIWIMIITITFHTEAMDGSFDLFSELRSEAKMPYEAYKGINFVLFSFILPFIFATSVPASFLVSKSNTTHTIGYLIVFICISTFVLLFWKSSIKKYSGASS